ncbi:MAG TPA: hypothetical protein PLV92_27920, partial [Pirellulaceae bacterium]|nr:hypothetical protein [Pirellulaceae bacterium]
MRTVWASIVVIGAASLLWSGPRESNGVGKGEATVSSGAAGEAKAANENKVVGEAQGKFVVHEWGTFTSITGSDGSRLEFRPLVHNDLPFFVVNRAWQAGKAPNPFGKWDVRTLQRMETPVTYFYTDREREVDVKVGFPLGLLTEFYPPVVSMKPAFDFKKRAEIGKSELDWGRVTLIPPERLMPHVSSPEIARAAHRRIVETLAPNSYSHPHYAHARDTDSAFVHVKHAQDNERPAAPAGDHFEKFLFYRGVGNFPLPLGVTALGNDSYEVTNKGAEELRSLFLVTSGEGGLQVKQVSRIEAGAKLTIRQSPAKVDSHFLANLVQKALVGEGLYEKEATAMVNTWRDSWFTEHGT